MPSQGLTPENSRERDTSSPDQTGADPSQSAEGAALQDAHSRRRFLRRAAITAAGVAGVAGAAGIAMSHDQLPGLLARTALADPVSYHDPSCCMCVTSSGIDQTVGNTDDTGFRVNNGGAQNPGDFFIWFTAPNLPPGTYNVTFTPDPAFSVMGTNPYYRDVYSAGKAKCCPDSSSGNTPKGSDGVAATQVNGPLLSSVFPYTVPGPSNQDVQLQVHMTYTGGDLGASGTHAHFTFSATFTKDGQATAVCTPSVTIEGTQK